MVPAEVCSCGSRRRTGFIDKCPSTLASPIHDRVTYPERYVTKRYVCARIFVPLGNIVKAQDCDKTKARPGPARPAEGATVRVEEMATEQPPTWTEVFKGLIGAVEGLPNDMAENHDHATVVQLTNVYHNLLRRWADA